MSSNNSSELYEHFDFTASSGQDPLRVDKFLMNFIDNATRNKIQKAAVNGNILVKPSWAIFFFTSHVPEELLTAVG